MGEIPKRPWHTGEDGAAIFDADGHRILDVGKRNAHLAEPIAEAVNAAGRTFCMWCGEVATVDRSDAEDTASKVLNHLLTCEKHPLRAAEAEIERLLAQVATLTQERDALEGFRRSVHRRLDDAGVGEENVGDRLDLLISERDEARNVLADALEASRCDGDLCMHDWHEEARRIGQVALASAASTPTVEGR